ncbi:DUF3298 and DUF4163 domain-containing protein [Salinimicrobium oceani]|uniref:DUF3298 and DUF4163 domain-containing protein n=1 Tax=Salinimicrobium oceani TaxID=2722702 RepID=A0ABX1CX48_9FLAO|nr:DUF3298 and DUF4163 domain-containing protein [Salinimicrobium oceani]NJW52870.1 DUF3298 and DUF4163 domain-containing protein [Salinimicrobium oceani]
MFRIFSRLLLIMIVFTGCRKDKEEKVSALNFKKESIVKKAGANCDTAEYDCSVITLDVVRARGASRVSEAINKNLDAHIINIIASDAKPEISDLDQLSEKFLDDYREAAESFSEEPPWEAYINENLYFKSDSLLSIGVTTEIFSGGAHGYKTLTFLNFNPNTGEVLSAKEIFTSEFSSFVEQRFRQEQGIPEGENINSTGFWFENDSFSLPENVGFTEDKVILVYNSYEIAPYAAGDIVMEIPLEEVRQFVKIE